MHNNLESNVLFVKMLINISTFNITRTISTFKMSQKKIIKLNKHV